MNASYREAGEAPVRKPGDGLASCREAREAPFGPGGGNAYSEAVIYSNSSECQQLKCIMRNRAVVAREASVRDWTTGIRDRKAGS